MLNPTQFKFCSEFYIVEKTIIVVVELEGQLRHVRLEAVQDSEESYSVRAYIEETAMVQLAAAEPGEEVEATTWRTFGLPDVLTADTADQALRQALSYLGERCG
jgi:hypothetical protein